jgi:polysaccharide biosynthesis protein PslH
VKILFLTSRLPYPPYRGDKLKIFNLIRQLSSQGHEITLLSFIASRNEVQYVYELQKYCRLVGTIHLPLWKSLFNCVLNVISQRPFQIAYYRSALMQRRIQAELVAAEYDVLHVHLIRMAQYALMKHSDIPRVLDLTDAGSLYLQRFLDTTKNVINKIFLKEELRRLWRYESVLGQFERCLVCSDVDKKFLLSHVPAARIDLLYNGIDLDYFEGEYVNDQHENRIIFTGNMSYFPNSDGIQYFVNIILPVIKKEIPRIQLQIVGKDPPRGVQSLVDTGITVTGFVQDIKDYYLNSQIAIAPIRFGAGTLNKILEPMALGIPVVTTSVGVEGLPVQHGKHLFIADRPEDFARYVIQLLTDDKLRQTLSTNAKALVRSLYGWDLIAQKLESYYTELQQDKSIQ